jgi:hypothetical protein
MTALAIERLTEFGGVLPVRGTFPIAATTTIYKGSLVGEDSSGRAIPATVLASCPRVLGRASATYNNATGSAAAYNVEVEYGVFEWTNSTAGDAIAADDIGKLAYAVDDQTVALTSNGGTRPIAGLIVDFKPTVLGGTSVPWVWSNPMVPVFYDTLTDLASTANAKGASLVGIEDSANYYAATTVEAALAEVVTDLAATTATNGASRIGVQDSGNFTTNTTVETCLAEVYQHVKSTQKQISIPLATFVDADGDPIVKFNNGVADGFTIVDSKACVYRVNNSANPPVIMTTVQMPQDLDDTADMVIHALISKSSNTIGDACTLTIAAYFQTPAALHDADANCGGTSSAIVGNAAAKTVTEVTLTIAAGDIPAAPSSMTMIMNITDGTLGTDDAFIHAVWIEYKGKALTS